MAHNELKAGPGRRVREGRIKARRPDEPDSAHPGWALEDLEQFEHIRGLALTFQEAFVDMNMMEVIGSTIKCCAPALGSFPWAHVDQIEGQ